MHQPDEAVAKDSGASFSPHPEGQFPMVCVDVVNLGINVEQFPGQEPRETAKVALVFASGERQRETKEQELTVVTTEMTLSANEKANLRKFLEAWRGRSYTSEQAETGLPVAKLYGQWGLLSIEHVTTRKGRKFAKITSIAPLPKAMAITEPVRAALLGEYTRPKFLMDRKAQYADALKKHRGANDVPTPAYPTGEDESDDETLPF